MRRRGHGCVRISTRILYPHIHGNTGDELKAIISVRKEGKYYVATDVVTNVADQGATEEEAVERLKKGLEEHYQILTQMAPKASKTSFVEIEVEK